MVFYAEGVMLHSPGSRVFERTLGLRPNNDWGEPEGRASVPHVPFVKFNPVFVQQTPEFILKGLALMVLLLVLDIRCQRGDMHRTDRERPVSVLPIERSQLGRLFLKPLR